MYQKALCLALLFILTSVVTALAAEKPDFPILKFKNDNEISFLCIEEHSVGFAWKEKKWSPINYQPTKQLIKRFNTKNSDGACERKLKGNPPTADDIKIGFTKGCYNIREFGKEIWDLESLVCDERWEVGALGEYELMYVNCRQSIFTPDIKFKPNGNFHASYVHSDLDDDKTEKDSIYISVGKCSVIEGSLISGNN